MTKRIISFTLILILILSAASALCASAADDITILGTRTLKTGQSAELNFKDGEGNPVSVNWVSSNEAIASVSSKGVVTGIKAGSAVVSTVWNGREYGVKVTVLKTTVAKVALSKTSLTMNTGDKKTLTLSYADASVIKWSSSSKAVATVNTKGTITAKKKGTATITAKYGATKYKCKLTVKDGVTAFAKLKKYLKNNGKLRKNADKIKYYSISWTSGEYDYEINYYTQYTSQLWFYKSKHTKNGGSSDWIMLCHFKDTDNAVNFWKSNPDDPDNDTFYTASFRSSGYTKSGTKKFTYISGPKGNPAEISAQANSWFKSAYSKWNSCIKENAGVTMKQLGFINY